MDAGWIFQPPDGRSRSRRPLVLGASARILPEEDESGRMVLLSDCRIFTGSGAVPCQPKSAEAAGGSQPRTACESSRRDSYAPQRSWRNISDHRIAADNGTGSMGS